MPQAQNTTLVSIANESTTDVFSVGEIRVTREGVRLARAQRDQVTEAADRMGVPLSLTPTEEPSSTRTTSQGNQEKSSEATEATSVPKQRSTVKENSDDG